MIKSTLMAVRLTSKFISRSRDNGDINMKQEKYVVQVEYAVFE